MATKAELIKEISELSEVEIEGLKGKTAVELKEILENMKSEGDGENPNPPDDKPKAPKETKAKVVEFKSAEVKDSKVKFNYTDGTSDDISILKDRKHIVEKIITIANAEININSKPTEKKELIERTKVSALCRIVRVVLNPDKITNAKSKNLLAGKKITNDELVDTIGIVQLRRIVDLYCEVEKTVRLS